MAVLAVEPSPAPPLTPDELAALGEEIATFAARIDVAEHALLTRLRTFDIHEAWGPAGFRSCAEWLSWRTGLGPKAAREKVRVARALGTLSKIDALFARGELSYSKVRAITRAATPESEQWFIDSAIHGTAAQIEKLSRAFVRHGPDAGDPNAMPRDQRRFVRRTETAGGMVRIEMQLPPEEAALVWEAMMAAMDAGTSAKASAPTPSAVDQASAEASTRLVPANDPEAHETSRADAIVDVARAYLQHRPRTLGSGYELVLVTSQEQLEHGPGGIGGFLRDGTPIPVHVARMLACDSSRIDLTLGKDGELLDVGRRTRTIPSAIGRALWLRDGGCRAPGCARKQHLHAHHIHAWAEGGPTKLSNLVLVCPGHHRMIHEGMMSVEICEGKFNFCDQQGREISRVPACAATGDDLEELELFLREADTFIDPGTNYPRWDGKRMDLADSLAWLCIAHQTGANCLDEE